jgi:hypothetical protein
MTLHQFDKGMKMEGNLYKQEIQDLFWVLTPNPVTEASKDKANKIVSSLYDQVT